MSDEFDFISKYLKPLTQNAVEARSLDDDAAVLSVSKGCELVLSKDVLVAGVHFLADEKPATIAKRALRTNLSDLAAMGAHPKFYLLGLSLPKGTTDEWLAAFCKGLAQDQAAFGVLLIGGDTVTTPGPLTISLTIIGECKIGMAISRAGAQIGDVICVSGTLGDAALGIKSLKGELPDYPALIDRFHAPQPRILLGQALVGIATAMADVSDGFAADLGHILRASFVGAKVECSKIPLSPDAKALVDQGAQHWEDILAGGDDYELVFTLNGRDVEEVKKIGKRVGVTVADVGQITQGDQLEIFDEKGQRLHLSRSGYEHKI